MPMFSKRHYEAIARTLRFTMTAARARAQSSKALAALVEDQKHTVAAFALMFTKDNEKFDQARFIHCCFNVKD